MLPVRISLNDNHDTKGHFTLPKKEHRPGPAAHYPWRHSCDNIQEFAFKISLKVNTERIRMAKSQLGLGKHDIWAGETNAELPR